MKEGTSAKALVDSYMVEDRNYKIARDALIARYQNTRDIAHSHLLQLDRLPVMNYPNGASIHTMVDAVTKVKSSITNLKANDKLHIDLLYSHTLLQKLDVVTRREFESSLANEAYSRDLN